MANVNENIKYRSAVDNVSPANVNERINHAYIHEIDTYKLRNIGNISILLGSLNDKPKHLLITGDNGVGKTTFVRSLYSALMFSEGGSPLSMVRYYMTTQKVDSAWKLIATPQYAALKNNIKTFCETQTVVTDDLRSFDYYAAVANGEFLVFFFGAKREEHFVTPDGPKRIEPREHGKMFIQMLVNLKTQLAFAGEDDDRREVERIEKWFDNLTSALGELLGHKDFKLEFLRKEFTFRIHEKGKEPYQFTQLSDGYSAIFAIMSEIMLSMGTDALLSYDMPGIVVIDELETHLHVELQKKVLPFLTRMFPNLQFVVTTHSPFVLSSIENSVIFDLGSKQRFENFSGYSYANIIEGFYDISGYSEALLSKLREIERIFEKEALSEEDRKVITLFDKEVESLPSFLPLELKNRWLTMKLHNIRKLA